MKSVAVAALSGAVVLAGVWSWAAAAGRHKARVRAESRPSQARALWVWDTGFIRTDSGSAAFFTFLKAKSIGRVFLSVPKRSFVGDEVPLRRFLATAHDQGIKVEALNGDPVWVLPRHQAECMEFVEATVRFNAAGAAGERFDAVHLDIEPQGLPEWKTSEMMQAAASYLALLRKAGRLARRERIRLAVDIPFGFNHIKIGQASLTERVVGLADEVALMAYRARADQIVRSSKPAVEAGDKLRTEIYVGISARPEHLIGNGSGVASVSYLETLAANVELAFRGHMSFEGVAIHDYRRYRALASAH